MNKKRSIPRHIITEMAKLKIKKRSTKSAKGERKELYIREPQKLSAFSGESLQGRRGWHYIST